MRGNVIGGRFLLPRGKFCILSFDETTQILRNLAGPRADDRSAAPARARTDPSQNNVISVWNSLAAAAQRMSCSAFFRV
jgi:hypothetical protein